jgi:RNA recognition motif-containing protein
VATVRVTQLSRNVNEQHLAEIFGRYGKVLGATVLRDR